MEYEEDMRPEKNTMPNYFSEWSGFIDEDIKSKLMIINYNPLYELEMKKYISKIEYDSDEEK